MILSHKTFKKIDGRTTELVITITPDMVNAVVLFIQPGKPNTVVGDASVVINTDTWASSESVIDTCTAALSQVCDKLSMQNHALFGIDDLLKDHQRIHHTTVYISSCLSNSATMTNEISFSNARKITYDDVQQLIDFEIPQGHTRIGSLITSVHANGYQTNQDAVMGKEAKDLQVSALDTYIRFDYIEQLFQVLHSKLNLNEEDVDFASVGNNIVRKIQSQYKPQGNYNILMVDNLGMHVYTFSNSILQKNSNCAFGFVSMIKTVKDSGVIQTTNQFESLTTAYISDHIDHVQAEKFEQAMLSEIKNTSEINEDINLWALLNTNRDWYVSFDNPMGKILVKLLQKHISGIRIIETKLNFDKNLVNTTAQNNTNAVTVQVNTQEQKNR